MPKLPRLRIKEDGRLYCSDLLGDRVCTGAKSGLANHLPADASVPVKLRLAIARLNAGGYAPNGAYFGKVKGLELFHAESVEELPMSSGPPGVVRLFVKVADRAAAKEHIRTSFLPNATFFR